MPLRVLAVDNFEPWRCFVSSALQGHPDIQDVLEVSDGLEAVQRAQDFRPDLILLDIGLPTLNGIKAAQRIRGVSPDSKILFLTEESSPDVAEAALEAGGDGYVVKCDAGRELLQAVKAVSEGKRYISAKLVGRVFVGRPDLTERSTFHELQIYSNDASLVDGFASFAAGGLNTGDAVLVLATDARRQGMDQKLQTQGFDLGVVVKSGAYISVDVSETLSSFMIDDRIDTERFIKLVDSVTERAGKAPNGAARRVVVCGECAPFLWARGKLEAALRMEELWDAVAHKFGLNTLCGYVARNVHGSEENRIMKAICSVHSRVIPLNATR
jgi:DNA-binding NarL/FixJ family response regulator